MTGSTHLGPKTVKMEVESQSTIGLLCCFKAVVGVGRGRVSLVYINFINVSVVLTLLMF